jgi:acyl-CoA synthetase (AMP-forming)/AMP-acid ligase II
MVDRQGRVGTIAPYDLTGMFRGDDGVLRYADLPHSLVQMLRSTVDRLPDAEALVELGGERLSYRQVWERATRVSGGLRQLGVGAGDRVAIHLPNGVGWALAFFGVQLAGAVVVPVNTRFAEREVAYVLEDSGAKFVFEAGEPLPDGEPLVADDAEPTDIAAIFYTSGTTGFPKGAMTTHENFLANCENCRRVIGFGADEPIRNLISVPLFHVTGCNSQLLITTQLGGTSVIMPQFDVGRFLDAIVDERIDVLTSVPAVYWLAMNQPKFPDVDVSGVGVVAYGGAPTPPELVARIHEAFPSAHLGNGFGLTETSSVATFLPHQYCETRPETVGFAAPVVELDLLDHDGQGVGELLIRGQNVVAGYWNKPEATAETIVDGWLHTGDLARIDDGGFVQIVDRVKDMINRGGENVYSVEVESALIEHPDVFEVAVVGVPDAMMGEKVGAVVVPKPGATLQGDELVAFASHLLAEFKVPEYVWVRDQPLDRNAGGKVLKAALREHTDWRRVR